MSKTQQIKDAINALPVAKQFAIPAEPTSVATRVLIGKVAKELGAEVKTWTVDGMVFIVRIK